MTAKQIEKTNAILNSLPRISLTARQIEAAKARQARRAAKRAAR